MIMAYIGPSIAGIVNQGTVFAGGYPPKVREMVERKPFLAELFVPVGELAQARKELKDPGSRLGLLCRRAEERS